MNSQVRQCDIIFFTLGARLNMNLMINIEFGKIWNFVFLLLLHRNNTSYHSNKFLHKDSGEFKLGIKVSL